MKAEVTLTFSTDEPLTQRMGERLWRECRRFQTTGRNAYEVEIAFVHTNSLPDAVIYVGDLVRATVGEDFSVSVDSVKAEKVK